MTSPAQRSTKTGAILFGVAYWVHIHLKPTSMCGINFVGGGGGFVHRQHSCELLGDRASLLCQLQAQGRVC